MSELLSLFLKRGKTILMKFQILTLFILIRFVKSLVTGGQERNDAFGLQEQTIVQEAEMVLKQYETNESNCFKDAAALIKGGCGRLKVSEEDKIKCKSYEILEIFISYAKSTILLDAIRLTKCEISTGNIASPPACDESLIDDERQQNRPDSFKRNFPWGLFANDADTKKNQNIESDGGGWKKQSYSAGTQSCVRAFAEVPQLWTSYSGYLRDVG
ncbi:hypothetical protein HK098_001454 [Nowakowskiella sp. JEL0407]|nr:hypothetical protein HK098_001454 [Nowakowskiella sp. JEL0407]